MCASLIDSKKLRYIVIGGCLALMAMPSPAAAQLFKRRGERENAPATRESVPSKQVQGSQNNAANDAAQANTGQPRNQVANRAGTSTPAAGEPISYDVPETENSEELARFLSRLLTFQPKTQEEAETYRQQAPAAMTLAAQKILQVESDQNSDIYMFAQKYLLAVDVMVVDQATPEEKQRLLEIIVANLQRPEMDADDLDIAVAFTEGLEMSGDNAMAGTAYTQFAQVFRGSKDPMIIELGMLMEGSARRLNLVGQTMNVQGTTFEGQAFDWSAYKGKVVLVDFWATWCGPCIKEIPALQQHYADYHDRGLEIVGICMNEQKEQVTQFFEKNEIPWVTLFEPEGKINPTAIHYGISSLPTTILVDQQGRVLSMSARGEELQQQLTKLLGPAK